MRRSDSRQRAGSRRARAACPYERGATVNKSEVVAFGEVSSTCADVWRPVGTPKAGVAFQSRRETHP